MLSYCVTLGVPTVADWAAQTGAATALEAGTEFGYRPRHCELDALATYRLPCWKIADSPYDDLSCRAMLLIGVNKSYREHSAHADLRGEAIP